MNSQNNRRFFRTAAALTTLAAASLANAAVPSDFNKSGSVGLEDLQAFYTAYYAGSKTADANGDGRLTYQDIITFAQQWVKAYSQPRNVKDKATDISRPANDSTLR